MLVCWRHERIKKPRAATAPTTMSKEKLHRLGMNDQHDRKPHVLARIRAGTSPRTESGIKRRGTENRGEGNAGGKLTFIRAGRRRGVEMASTVRPRSWTVVRRGEAASSLALVGPIGLGRLGGGGAGRGYAQAAVVRPCRSGSLLLFLLPHRVDWNHKKESRQTTKTQETQEKVKKRRRSTGEIEPRRQAIEHPGSWRGSRTAHRNCADCHVGGKNVQLRRLG